MSSCEFPLDSDHLDRLPDSLLLLLFNRIADVKSLGRCCLVSRRFHSLVPLVDTVVVPVHCILSDDHSSSSPFHFHKSRPPFLTLLRFVFSSLFKPLGHLLFPHRSSAIAVPHHSPTQELNNFHHIKSLRIELPSGELGTDPGGLLKWRADFGSTLDNCVILGASSATSLCKPQPITESPANGGDLTHPNNADDSFYTNGGLKSRVMWTISSLIAASARHYLLQSTIVEHPTINNLVLTDADGQGVLCMNREQLEELRVKSLSATTDSKRTLVPALNMRLWYAPQLELPGGILLKGATLVVIRPSHHSASTKDISDLAWVSNSFEEPYGTAAKMLVKGKTYCLEMNSF